MEATRNKILVVDDDFLIRSILKEILISRDYEVDEAENGKQALDMYCDTPVYKLIISDMNMPIMSGLDLIKEFRSTQIDTPIIILSGNDEISTAMDALNHGANDYLLKDENIQETVFVSIDRVLEKKQLQEQNAQLMADLTIKNETLEQFNETLSKTVSDLTKIGTALSAEKDMTKLLEMIVSDARSVTKADIGVLYIVENEKLAAKIYQNISENRFMGGTSSNPITMQPVDPSEASLVAKCFLRKDIINAANLGKETDTIRVTDIYDREMGNSSNIESESHEHEKSLVLLPLLDRDNRALGVLELKNSRNSQNNTIEDFHKNEIAIAFSLASQAAVSIENTRNLETIEKKKESFQRFVPTDFISMLDREEIEDVEIGDSSHENMSVLFSDIRSFTTLSESMTPVENFVFLNNYLKTIGPSIQRYGGFIDKFIGDAIMALFIGKIVGAANDSVDAAIEMQIKVREFNFFRRRNHLEPVAIGVGLHTGPLSLGTIGFEKRMETTVIGDTVNLASRMEGLTKQYGINIAITSETVTQLSEKDRFFFREIDTVKVKGKNLPITVYDLFNGDADNIKEKKIVTFDSFDEALNLYKARKWNDALNLFEEIRQSFEDDKILQIYSERCKIFLNSPPDENWDGVFTLTQK